MNPSTTGDDADFLPVGMLTNGHAAVQMMQTIAINKQGVAGWEPFHYEKISATEYELTGGLLTVTGNSRKWLEPHTTVIVSEEEIATALRATMPPVVATAPVPDLAAAAPVIAPAVSTQYMTVTLTLPADEAGRQRLRDALRVGSDFFGATVIANSL
ncbi:hypothetical protein RGU70_02960 [Herbaspirillum sp. RTI4]|uniref:hypothetical protein n=1 Tax=Herbaspirillum sp. RTI4 TaxID=3048640 RepID=UPI002AB510FF|nr:hypothetical protein [Herbaspirillum sp. RTI4]MDY7577289.1 hypothetical protein [Herbaspirillum sp. RTI4]MEA9982945.1 hypothetical protein [Herbaspirillum sp. RTI4]